MIESLPNAATIEDETSPVYFLHIPKTAGTTFYKFLSSKFGEKNVCPAYLWHDLLQLSATQITDFSLICGHFYSYLHRYVPGRVRYMTFLRDPVERALSHYGHIMFHEGHYLHHRARALGDFSCFLRDSEMATTLTNFQVRALTIDHDPVAIASTLTSQALANLELERLLETAVPSKSDGEMLEVAKHRLAQMCFVGITERFEESLVSLCNKFAWELPTQVESQNASIGRLKQHQLSPVDVALLRKMNEADYALYEFAERHFMR